ncbi:MAG: DNA translocase FtsK 4TM domain-containing protein [Methylococcaceae bacterium]|nr:DNA translocase FtsK 4TM domain-containing protein [Methylococcaceae bacterium]
MTALALFFLISLATFNLDDPGWTSSGSGAPVKNAGGAVGAWVSDFLLAVFGVTAGLFPIMIIYRGILSYRVDAHNRNGWNGALRWAGFGMTVVSGASLAHVHFVRVGIRLPETSGGLLGEDIGQILINGFGITGATVLLLAGFLAGITLSTGLSWIALIDGIGKITLALLDKVGALSAALYRHMTSRNEKSRFPEIEAPPQRVAASPKPSKPPRIEPVFKPIEPAETGEMNPRPNSMPPAEGTLPHLSLLDEYHSKAKGYSKTVLDDLSRKVEAILHDFGVDVEVVEVHPGPVITRFEIQPAAGVKVSRVSGLSKDLARALSVRSVRVVEIIPGKSVIGLEIPNEEYEMVSLREVLASEVYEESASPLTLVLGKDIGGKPVIADLAKMPHLLVAGTTGSGKSVAINTMILSLLYKSTAADVRMIMIDPKMLELSVYEGIPHLLTPVVTDMKDAANALRWCVAEMERRYRLMSWLGVRNLGGFNRKVKEAQKNGTPIKDPFANSDSNAPNASGTPDLTPLPNIVIVIDELADMMMIVGKKVEQLIARLAQKARAAGLHLVLATQRPSVDVLTGLIKANIPTRIAFQVSSKIDSRTIIDQGGAESLLGNGDMLFQPAGTNIPIRAHGAFVDDHEVHRVVEFLKSTGEAVYLDEITREFEESATPGGTEYEASESDPLYDEAVRFVTESRRASISSVQRKFKIGYNRAARMVEDMERAGVVSAAETNGSREVLVAAPPGD